MSISLEEICCNPHVLVTGHEPHLQKNSMLSESLSAVQQHGDARMPSRRVSTTSGLDPLGTSQSGDLEVISHAWIRSKSSKCCKRPWGVDRSSWRNSITEDVIIGCKNGKMKSMSKANMTWLASSTRAKHVSQDPVWMDRVTPRQLAQVHGININHHRFKYIYTHLTKVLHDAQYVVFPNHVTARTTHRDMRRVRTLSEPAKNGLPTNIHVIFGKSNVRCARSVANVYSTTRRLYKWSRSHSKGITMITNYDCGATYRSKLRRDR